METTQVMVPGILLALKTGVNGGVEYRRETLEEDPDGSLKKWRTTRTMEDPDERRAANNAVSKAAKGVSRLCVRTSFGLLCPTEREGELDEAIASMRQQARDWNRQAQHSFINVSAIKGRIADNDEEAIRAILEEAKDLLARMDKGLADTDVDAIRKAATRAKSLAAMMTEDSSADVVAALDAARAAARAIVRRGEAITDKVVNAQIESERDAFDKARFSFIDAASKAVDALPSGNVQRFADLEVAS